MIQPNMHSPKTLIEESEQAISFLTKLSSLLKQQRRYFDDAVATHCIRLIKDHVEGVSRENPSGGGPGVGGSERSF